MVSLDEFIDAVDLVVIMVKHNEIKGNRISWRERSFWTAIISANKKVLIISNSKETVGKKV